MKKATKKVQDTGAVKVIPPYPRWVKKFLALMIGFSVLMVVILTIDRFAGMRVSNALFLPLLGLSALSTLIVFYFPRPAFCVLALLVIVGVSILLLPAWFRQRFLKIFFDSSSIIFLVLDGLIVGQGILALFWKKARNFGWLISYTVLFAIIAITGQVYDYVTRDSVGYYREPKHFEPGRPVKPIVYPVVECSTNARVGCDESGIVALQINPDNSITVINKGVLDTMMTHLGKGAFEELTLGIGDRHRNMLDDHVYDYT